MARARDNDFPGRLERWGEAKPLPYLGGMDWRETLQQLTTHSARPFFTSASHFRTHAAREESNTEPLLFKGIVGTVCMTVLYASVFVALWEIKPHPAEPPAAATSSFMPAPADRTAVGRMCAQLCGSPMQVELHRGAGLAHEG